MTKLTGVAKILDDTACHLLKKAEDSKPLDLDYLTASMLINNLCLQVQMKEEGKSDSKPFILKVDNHNLNKK